MKAEEKVSLLSEELKRVSEKFFANVDRCLAIDQNMEEAYEEGYYDIDDYRSWVNDKMFLADESEKLNKQRKKLVRKLNRIIKHRKLNVDEETADLLNNID